VVSQGEGGSSSGTSMTPVTGDGNGEGEAMGCRHFGGGPRQLHGAEGG
jgi:hypothetical protein